MTKDEEIAALKENSREEFESAANFDDIMRTHRVSVKSKVFLHPSLKPLREIDFTDYQGDMFANECEGHCGL